MTEYTRSATYQRCQARFDRTYPGFIDAGSLFGARVADRIGPTTRVLDVGAGRMSLAGEALRRAGLTVGIDLVLADLRRNRDLAAAVVADATALPFADGGFDLVVSEWVVEHFADPGRAFAELARVLVPGGRVILFTTNAHNYVPLAARCVPAWLRITVLQRLLRRPAHESHPVYYRANTRSALDRLAAQSGLVLAECTFVGNPFYLAFAEPLFRLALAFEQLTDRSALRGLKLYIVATLEKPGA